MKNAFLKKMEHMEKESALAIKKLQEQQAKRELQELAFKRLDEDKRDKE